MSRIGKLPVRIPDKVMIQVEEQTITVTGPRGVLTRFFPKTVTVNSDNNFIKVFPSDDSPSAQQLYGTYRSLVSNMIHGVLHGFEKKLELQGVGYRSQLDGKVLVLNVGYSHPVRIQTPDTIKLSIENNTTITVSGADKELVGRIAANIRTVRPPEPYKGKGIRYQGEYVRKKIGKTGKK